MLIINGQPPIFWAVGGALIALITLFLLAVANRRLGISTSFESVCSLVLKAPYFRRPDLLRSNPWRLSFLVGLVLGGALSAAQSGSWAPTWELGMFDQRIQWGPLGKVAWMFVGGAFIGFGTRMAGGCTSGHCIFGVSNFEKSGIVSTLSFMAAGFATTNLLYRVVAP